MPDMLEVAHQDLVPGRIYQIRGRAGTPYSATSIWGNFLVNYQSYDGTEAVFTNFQPPLGNGLTSWHFPPEYYTFHQENPDNFARRKAAIYSHARTTQNMTGNQAKPSNYAPLSTSKAPGSRKNRHCRKNRKQMSRRR